LFRKTQPDLKYAQIAPFFPSDAVALPGLTV
jgi:hypothetical protein